MATSLSGMCRVTCSLLYFTRLQTDCCSNTPRVHCDKSEWLWSSAETRTRIPTTSCPQWRAISKQGLPGHPDHLQCEGGQYEWSEDELHVARSYSVSKRTRGRVSQSFKPSCSVRTWTLVLFYSLSRANGYICWVFFTFREYDLDTQI